MFLKILCQPSFLIRMNKARVKNRAKRNERHRSETGADLKGRYLKMKKLLTVGLVLMMLVGLMVPAFAAGTGEYMWVNCANGKTLNLRADANTKARVLKRLECGTRVELIPYSNPTAGWSCVRANGTDGWVMTKFLVASKPGKYEITERDDNFQDVSAYNVTAMAINNKSDRSVCLRTRPNKTAKSIRRLTAGDQLQVIAVGRIWDRVIDLTTGQTGYVANDYMARS